MIYDKIKEILDRDCLKKQENSFYCRDIEHPRSLATKPPHCWACSRNNTLAHEIAEAVESPKLIKKDGAEV